MKRTTIKDKGFWVKATPGGETEFRKSSKVLFALAPFLVALLLYRLLIAIEGLEMGREIISVLAYSIVVFLVALILLVIIISIIEYLRRFEQ